MRITEGLLREIVRKELLKNTDASEEQHLNEILKAITGAFKEMFSGLAQILGSAFTDAKTSKYDASKYGIKHSTGKSIESLEPKKNAYDQVYVLSQTLWHVGAGVDLALQSAKYAKDWQSDMEIPTDEAGQEKFASDVTQVTEYVADAAGSLAGYLAQSKSNRLEEIGMAIDPGEKMTDAIESMAAAITELESVDPRSEFEKIIQSGAVQKVIKGDDQDAASEMQSLINETKTISYANIGLLGELKETLDEVYQNAKLVEQANEQLAADTGEKVEDSELVDHVVFSRSMITENRVRLIIRRRILDYYRGMV
jgi:hypothetical protein|tara:strand:- start:337 stop:1269 length:933 start_codon:yes stop_codon:yes gene_type:complete